MLPVLALQSQATFSKVYCAPVPSACRVAYTDVAISDILGQPVLKGAWRNTLEGTEGLFAARKEE